MWSIWLARAIRLFIQYAIVDEKRYLRGVVQMAPRARILILVNSVQNLLILILNHLKHIDFEALKSIT